MCADACADAVPESNKADEAVGVSELVCAAAGPEGHRHHAVLDKTVPQATKQPLCLRLQRCQTTLRLGCNPRPRPPPRPRAAVATGCAGGAEPGRGFSSAGDVSWIRRIWRELGCISTNGCRPSSAGETSNISNF